jgi:DNA-3-methyladenine glycosylase II
MLSLIKKYPAPTFENRSAFLYEDLIESIISQQLSIKAADTIFGRFKALFHSRHPELVSGSQTLFPDPEHILSKSDDELRAVGLSYQKASYIKSIANTFATKQIDPSIIAHMQDEEVITELTKIKGVGKWTAEMILIFTLNRPDIFSIGDLGLRNAITKLYGITNRQEMLELAATWAPNRSTASWYLWRSLENKKD